MKRVTAKEAHQLREKGLTYKKIGETLGCSKGVAYRLVKKFPTNPEYSELVGNKKNKKFRAIWDYLCDPRLPYFFVGKILRDFPYPLSGIERETLRDYLLDFAYTLDLSDKEDPTNYLFVALRNKVRDYFKKYEIEKVSYLEENFELTNKTYTRRQDHE